MLKNSCCFCFVMLVFFVVVVYFVCVFLCVCFFVLFFLDWSTLCLILHLIYIIIGGC